MLGFSCQPHKPRGQICLSLSVLGLTGLLAETIRQVRRGLVASLPMWLWHLLFHSQAWGSAEMTDRPAATVPRVVSLLGWKEP